MNEPDSRRRALSSTAAWQVSLVPRMIIGSSSTVTAVEGHADSPPPALELPGAESEALPLADAYDLSGFERSLTDVIVSRRSGGISGEGPVSQRAFATLLAATAAALPAPMLPYAGLAPVLFPVVFDVAGVPPAAYRYVPAGHRLVPLRKIEREAFADEFLLQTEHGSGSAVLFMAAPLSRWLHRFGDRGYRAANFQIGYISDRLYLLAETLGLTYTSSGGFAPAGVDELLGLDGYHLTTLFSFVVGGPRATAGGLNA